jgi:hypothetical protein
MLFAIKCAVLSVAALALAPQLATASPGEADEPIRVEGQTLAEGDRADGGLRPVIGVTNLQIFRASRAEKPGGVSNTYNHGPMLCHWNKRFYVSWVTNAVSEHEVPSYILFSSSDDGVSWTDPKELFPPVTVADGRQSSWNFRMGWFPATNGKLLALSFLGMPPNPVDGTGVGRAAREVRRDGSLGPIYFVRLNRHKGWSEANVPYPMYSSCKDPEFRAACDELLANRLLTQQWWEEEQLADQFFAVQSDGDFKAKAFSFFERQDGAYVGVWKGGYGAISRDAGRSWSKPVRCPTVATTFAKLWGQRTSDGRCALAYDPAPRNRWPLAVATSGDGITFHDLATVHGEVPPRRYAGKFKDVGPQYVRGLELGSTSPDDAMWLAYSMNKEDLWLARVPVPIVVTATGECQENFDAAPHSHFIPGWNLYSTLRSAARIIEESPGKRCLLLNDHDAHDHAMATRVFPRTSRVDIRFRLFAKPGPDGGLEIDVQTADGKRPFRFRESGATPGWTDYRIQIDCAQKKWTIERGERTQSGTLEEPASSVERIVFRTGPWRGVGPAGGDVLTPDQPIGPSEFLIDDIVTVGSDN